MEKCILEQSDHQIYSIVLPLTCPRVRMQMTTKGNVVLYSDKELVEKSKEITRVKLVVLKFNITLH
jgi:hypothetical protein